MKTAVKCRVTMSRASIFFLVILLASAICLPALQTSTSRARRPRARAARRPRRSGDKPGSFLRRKARPMRFPQARSTRPRYERACYSGVFPYVMAPVGQAVSHCRQGMQESWSIVALPSITGPTPLFACKFHAGSAQPGDVTINVVDAIAPEPAGNPPPIICDQSHTRRPRAHSRYFRWL